MTGSDFDPQRLERFFTSAEPAELRNYLALPGGSRVNHLGSTVPALGLTRRLDSGIWVPASASVAKAPIDLAQVFITYSSITESVPSWPELVHLVSLYSVEETLHAVGRLLRLLHDSRSAVAEVEANQVSLLREPLASRLRAQLATGHALITRQGSMALAKLAVAHGGAETTATVPLEACLGVLIAAVHDHLGGNRVEEADERKFGGLPLRLSASIVANHWFNRSFDEASFLTMYDSRWNASRRPSVRPVVEAFAQSVGFDIEDQALLALAAWAASRSEGYVSFQRDYFAPVGLDRTKMDAILAVISCGIGDASEEIRAKELSEATLEWTFDVFERYPVLELSDGRLLVLEPAYLIRRCMGWAPIYDIDVKRRSSEHSLANASETYAFDVLEAMYGGGPVQRLYTDGDLKRLSPIGKRADAAVDFGAGWAVIEVTSRRPIRGMLHGEGLEPLEQQMEICLEEVQQIAATAHALSVDSATLTGTPSAGTSKYYPLLVMTEGFPTNPITLSEIRRRAEETHAFDGLHAAPIEVIDIVELEMIEAIVESGGPTFPELVDQKQGSNFAVDSFRNFLLTGTNLEVVLPARVSESFAQPLSRLAERIRPGGAADFLDATAIRTGEPETGFGTGV